MTKLTSDGFSRKDLDLNLQGVLSDEMIDKIADRVIEKIVERLNQFNTTVNFNKFKWDKGENKTKTIDNLINQAIVTTKNNWDTVKNDVGYNRTYIDKNEGLVAEHVNSVYDH